VTVEAQISSNRCSPQTEGHDRAIIIKSSAYIIQVIQLPLSTQLRIKYRNNTTTAR